MMVVLRVLFFSLWLFVLSTSRYMVDEKDDRTGNNVTLSCSGEFDTVQDAEWWFNSTPIAESTCYMNFTRPSAACIKLQISPECEGMVSCAEKGRELTNDSDRRPIYAYPVVKNDSVAVVRAEKGASVVLDCRLQVSALNNIVVSWRVQRGSCPTEPLPTALVMNNYSLVLENINSSHSGTYRCAGSARHYPNNQYLQYDFNYVTKETVTLLEVEEFHPPRLVSNLTAEKETDDTIVFSVEAVGSSPIRYSLLINNLVRYETEEQSEGENAQLKINISSLANGVSIVTVVASNEDKNGHRHSAATDSVIVRQDVIPTSTTVLPDGWSAECLGGSGAGGFLLCLGIVIIFGLIICFAKKGQSKKLQTHDIHMAHEDGSIKGGSSVMPRSYTETHSETHFSIDSANVYRHPPSPLAIVLMTVAAIMHMKEQRPELQLLASLEKIFAEVSEVLAPSRSWLVVILNEQVAGILEEKKRTINASKKKNDEETSGQSTAELSKLESISKMLNTWLKTHKCKNNSGSSISDSPIQGYNMANIFILLSRLLQVSRSPNYVCFTFLEEIIPLTLQGIFMVDDRVIEQVHDLQEQLEKLNNSLSRGSTAEDRQIIQSIGNSHDTVLTWIQQCRRH